MPNPIRSTSFAVLLPAVITNPSRLAFSFISHNDALDIVANWRTACSLCWRIVFFFEDLNEIDMSFSMRREPSLPSLLSPLLSADDELLDEDVGGEWHQPSLSVIESIKLVCVCYHFSFIASIFIAWPCDHPWGVNFLHPGWIACRLLTSSVTAVTCCRIVMNF